MFVVMSQAIAAQSNRLPEVRKNPRTPQERSAAQYFAFQILPFKSEIENPKSAKLIQHDTDCPSETKTAQDILRRLREMAGHFMPS
jgi:hypothetical protein